MQSLPSRSFASGQELAMSAIVGKYAKIWPYTGITKAHWRSCLFVNQCHVFIISFTDLSSKTVATTCHHPNSSSLSISSVDHFFLKPSWMYTFQLLLLTLIYFPFSDTHFFTPFFVIYEIFLWNPWCFDLLNLHILYHRTLLLNNLVNIGSRSLPTKCILSEVQTQNSSSLLNLTGILNASPKHSTGSMTMKSMIVYPVSQMILYSLLYPSPINLGHQVLVTILL